MTDDDVTTAEGQVARERARVAERDAASGEDGDAQAAVGELRTKLIAVMGMYDEVVTQLAHQRAVTRMSGRRDERIEEWYRAACAVREELGRMLELLVVR